MKSTFNGGNSMEVRDAITKLDFMAKDTTLLPEMQEACLMGVKALEMQEKLQKMVETLEENLLNASTCTVIDMSNEYEQAKYQVYYKSLKHLQNILKGE